MASAKLGPVSTKDRNGVTGLFPRAATGLVPAATQKVIVKMVSVRKEGAYHDGYFDNVEMRFTKG